MGGVAVAVAWWLSSVAYRNHQRVGMKRSDFRQADNACVFGGFDRLNHRTILQQSRDFVVDFFRLDG